MENYKRLNKTRLSAGSSARLLARLALLAALSFIFGKFLQIPIGNALRISFENLPLLLAGWLYGPIAGGMCAAAADILGCMLRGYAINPIITLGAAAVGTVCGLFGLRGVVSRPQLWLAVTAAHLCGSVIIKSIGLYVFFTTPLETLVWRLPIYLVTGAAEYGIITLLMKNKAARPLLENI